MVLGVDAARLQPQFGPKISEGAGISLPAIHKIDSAHDHFVA